MRTLFGGCVVALLSVGGIFAARAQTNAGSAAGAPVPAAAHENWMVAFLSPDEQLQYAKARAKALADNPGLKAEGEALMKQVSGAMAEGSLADQQGFRERMISHRQKLRAAMLQVDPGLGPIFAKIDAHLSEMKVRAREAAAQKASGATNSPPATGSTPSP